MSKKLNNPYLAWQLNKKQNPIIMRLLTLLSFCIFFMSNVSGQGIEFFQGTWDEALAEAKKQDKIIFVDAYAVWCGPCKRMSKNVFPHKEVGQFYNKNFVNLKLDMERGEGAKFRKKYPVSAFPTLFYIDYTGEIVMQVKGAQDVRGFIGLGSKALKKVDRSGLFAADYEKGNRDPELVYNYVKALNKAGKPSLKIANEYIRSQKDLNSEQNLRFILEAASEVDSRVFDLMIERRKAIEVLTSKEEVEQRILDASKATADKAIEFKSKDLLTEAHQVMKKHYPAMASTFIYQTEMGYCLSQGEMDDYLSACKSYAKKVAKNNPDDLSNLAVKIANNFQREEKAMAQAESFAAQAAKKSTNYKHWMNYASILNRNGKQSKAVEAAKTSLELVKENDPKQVKMVETFLRRIAS